MISTGTETYAQARARFLSAAQEFGYDVSTHHLSGHTGPAQEDLFCDVALKRSGKLAPTALVTTSGVHGVEGFAGSTLQRAWMGEEQHRGFDLVHVHALNPYGFAWDRRADHHNIDVCRNFVSFSGMESTNPGYQKYADIIVPSKGSRLRNELRIIALQVSPGAAAMKDIITKGQYTHPQGMYYGGKESSWSRLVWEKIITDLLSSYQQVIHLDIHTGLGAYGDLQVIGTSGAQKEAALAREAWGQRLAFMNHNGQNNSLSSPTSGDIEHAWSLVNGARPGAAATYTFEFGTRPPLQVFRALQAEHAAYARGEQSGSRDVRALMRQAFAPSDDAWIDAVLRNGTKAYEGIAAILEKSPLL